MSNYTRKDFIKLSSLGLLATLVPVNEVLAVSRVFQKNIQPTPAGFEEAKKLAKIAKELFYKKEYQKAIDTYLRCIQLAPNYIQFYDCLSNVYGTVNNHLANAELFKQGLLKNPKKGAFYDRAARSLIHLEFHQGKQAQTFKNTNRSAKKDIDLLADAQELYKKAIALEGNKKYLLEGQQQLLTKKQEKQNNLASTNARSANVKAQDNKKAKLFARRNTHKQLKKLHLTKTDLELETLIHKMESKKRTQLFVTHEKKQQEYHINKQKKKHLRILLDRHKQTPSKRAIIAKRIFDLDASDSLAIHHLKTAYQKNNKYFEIIKEQQKFAEAHPSIYSYIGVVDAIQQAYEKKQISKDALTNAINILQMILDTYSLTETSTVDVIDKLAIIQTLKGDFISARTTLEELILDLTTNAPASVNKIILRYTSVLLAEGKTQQAKQIILLGLNELESLDTTTENLLKIQELSKAKLNESFKHKEPLIVLAYHIFKTLGNLPKAQSYLQQLLTYSPKNTFAIKRIKTN